MGIYDINSCKKQQNIFDTMLTFRNWLRLHHEDRNKYQEVKQELARREWRHIQHYADAKNSIVQRIMDRANSQ